MERGTRLGAYEILGEMASGGMATVYIARHLRLGHIVALKILHPHYQQDENLRTRFVDEARIQANLRHQHILAVQDILELPTASGMVMELLDGCTLSTYYRKVEKPLANRRAVWLFTRLADALAYAHEMNVVHRDLKPSNVYLHRVGTEAVPKLMDFGIAKLKNVASESQMTAAGSMLGTPQYMAPEQFEDSSTVDPRADIYALGVMMYEACAGMLPFEGQHITQIMKQVMSQPAVPLTQARPDFPKSLEDVILACLRKDRATRFQCARAVKEALESVAAEIGSESIVATVVPPTDLKSRGIETAVDLSSRKQVTTASDKPETPRPPTREEVIAMSAKSTDTAIPQVMVGEDVAPTQAEKPRRRLLTAGAVLLLAAAAAVVTLLWPSEKPDDAATAPPGPTSQKEVDPGAVSPAERTPPAEAAQAQDVETGHRDRRPPAAAETSPVPEKLSVLPVVDGLSLGRVCESAAAAPDLLAYMNARLQAGWRSHRLSALRADQLELHHVSPADLERFREKISEDALIKEMASLASRAVAPFKEEPFERTHLARLQITLAREPDAVRYVEVKAAVLCETPPLHARGKSDTEIGTRITQILSEKGIDHSILGRWESNWESDALIRAEFCARALCCLLNR